MPKITTNKAELVSKSLDVFLKNGYYHTSFADLARVCGIEKSLFYYYFKDKQDLMTEVLKYAHQIVENNVFAAGQNPNVIPKTNLNALLQAVYKFHAQNPYGCFMGNTLLETVNRANDFQQVLTQYFDRFKAVLTRIYSSVPGLDNPEQRAINAIVRLQGSIMLMRLYNDTAYLADTIEQLVNEI